MTNDQLSPSEVSLPVDPLLKDSDESKDRFEDEKDWLQAGEMSKSFSNAGSSDTFGGGGNSNVGGAVGG